MSLIQNIIIISASRRYVMQNVKTLKYCKKKEEKKNHFQTINLLHFSMISVMNKICVLFIAELKVID